MNILTVNSLYKEKKGFVLDRKDIGSIYIFIHFLTPVNSILNGKETKIYPGGCVFYGLHSSQFFESLQCELVHDWFHADNSCGELMYKYGLKCETVYYPKESDEITRFICDIEIENMNKEKNYKKIIDCTAEKLFIKLSRACSQYNDDLNADRQRDIFLNARRKIHMNFADRWTVEDMAKLVNMSESRFYVMYKRIFGISPAKDLSRKRIQSAQALLLRDECTVSEVAELTGFTNQYHFIRQFRQLTGITPGKFKMINR